MASPVCNGVDYRKRFSGNPSSEPGRHDGDDSSLGKKSSIWCGDLTVETMENLHLLDKIDKTAKGPIVALIYIYGDWNPLPRASSSLGKTGDSMSLLANRLQAWLAPCVKDLECQVLCGKLQLTEDSVDELEKLPPHELPTLALVSQKRHANRSLVQYLSESLPAPVLQNAMHAKSHDSSAARSVKQAIQSAVRQVEMELELGVSLEQSQAALRIFVAGDRSSVGKSSVCLYVPSRQTFWAKLREYSILLTHCHVLFLFCLCFCFVEACWATWSRWDMLQRIWHTLNLPLRVNLRN